MDMAQCIHITDILTTTQIQCMHMAQCTHISDMRPYVIDCCGVYVMSMLCLHYSPFTESAVQLHIYVTYKYTHADIQTYIYTYIHTYTHTYIDSYIER